MAETSGAAARMSTAAARARVAAPPGDRGARGEPGALHIHEKLSTVLGLAGERGEEGRYPDCRVPGRVGLQRPRAGQRHGRGEEFFPCPEADQGGADRRTGTALAVAVDPLAHAVRGGEQRGAPGLCRQASLRLLDVTFLVEVRCHQPLVQVQRMAGGIEDGAAVDDAERAVHAQSKTFEHGGEVPGIDRQAVDRGLAAHRVEAGAIEEGLAQRVAAERLVEPGEGGGGEGERRGEGRIDGGR